MSDFDGYPSIVLDELIHHAEQQFAENAHKTDEYGDRAWLADEPRWHLFKAHDELSDATYHSKHGDRELAMRRMGDALNHLVFAADTMLEENDGE